MKYHLQCAILLDIFNRTNIAVRMSCYECRIICTLDFFFFIKLFHAIIIMIKAAFYFKYIFGFLNVLIEVSLFKIFNNTNFV